MILERGSRLVNRYRIEEILGQGGMGSVYRAEDENVKLVVAVKDNLFTTEEYARQFRREAELLASLRHPNLPRVTDHFVIDGQGQYLVMDYIEGEDLRQRMDRQGTLTDQEVVYIGAAVCDALAYLHSRRPCIVHRDIKPGNIKITGQGVIYLVDFGLAKTIEDGSQATTTGARAMTPGYSPPEQYGTARTDQRSDIFSLGATLYAALTGAIPEDALSRAMDQCDLTPIRSHNSKVSKRLASVIERSLAVRPDERYQSAEDFKQALLSSLTPSQRRQENYVVSPPPYGAAEDEGPNGANAYDLPGSEPRSPGMRARISSSPLPVSIPTNDGLRPGRLGPRRRRPVWLYGLVGTFTVVLLTLAVLNVLRPGMLAPLWAGFLPPASATPTLPPTTEQPGGAATPGGAVIAPAITPTATLEFTPTYTATSAPTAMPAPTSTTTPTITPTPTPLGGGAQIAYASDPVSDPNGEVQIYMTDLRGQNVVKITDIRGGACQPAWSPDGLRLVFISPCERDLITYLNSGLFIINADGSDLTPLTTGGIGGYDPDWSPDGKKIVFTSVTRTGRPEISVLNLEDNSVELLSELYARDLEPNWSPDGRKILFISERNGRQLWQMNADGSQREEVSPYYERIYMHPAWSPDMSAIIFTQLVAPNGIPRLMVTYSGQEVYEEFPFSPDKVPMREASWSPDGYWVAFESWEAGANHNIYIAAANGAGRTQVTQGSRIEFDAAWRPTP